MRSRLASVALDATRSRRTGRCCVEPERLFAETPLRLPTFCPITCSRTATPPFPDFLHLPLEYRPAIIQLRIQDRFRVRASRVHVSPLPTRVHLRREHLRLRSL